MKLLESLTCKHSARLQKMFVEKPNPVFFGGLFGFLA